MGESLVLVTKKQNGDIHIQLRRGIDACIFVKVAARVGLSRAQPAAPGAERSRASPSASENEPSTYSRARRGLGSVPSRDL